LSFIPCLYRHVAKGTGGTDSVRYCYSVWLRHLVIAYKNGLSTNPNVIAELGPGDSLGMGLAALISGSEKYYAFDVVEYADNKTNLKIFDELIDLFTRREKIPDKAEFPNVRPYLDSYEFPTEIFTQERLDNALNPERLKSIRNVLLNINKQNDSKFQITYFAPWNDMNIVEESSVDMIFTQGVMQLVDNLESAYEILAKWLKPGGYMSHETDFTCFRTAKQWNGYLTYSDFLWKLIKGKRQCLVNREPHSKHITIMEKLGFEIVCDKKIKDFSGIKRRQLAAKFEYMDDDDLSTSGAFIQAFKKTLSN
jgi:hypothetical protein